MLFLILIGVNAVLKKLISDYLDMLSSHVHVIQKLDQLENHLLFFHKNLELDQY